MFLPKGLRNPDIRGVFSHYWRVAGARPIHVLISVVLALIATGFEGASFSLLIPLTNGLADNSLDSLSDSRYFGWIEGVLPASLADSPSRDAYLIVVLLTFVILGRAGKLGVGFAQNMYLHSREEIYLARVRTDTFMRVLSFGRQYFDMRALGSIDVEISWSQSVVDILIGAERLIQRTLSLIAKAIVMLFLSVPLSLTMLLAGPLIVVALRRLNAGINRLAYRSTDLDRQLRTEALDLLSTVSLVKSSGQEALASQRYGEILDEASGITTRRRNLRALRWPVEEMLVLLVVLSSQVAIALMSDSFRPSDLVRTGAFLLLVQQILPDLRKFSEFATDVAVRLPKLEALAALLSNEGKHIVVSGNHDFLGLKKGISVKHLSFSYAGGTRALSDLSAEIPVGAVTAVVGTSGSGKSTFANLLARLYDCEAGTIFLDGVDIREYSLSTLHRGMAIVSQEVWLLNRTLRANLTYGLDDSPSDEELVEVLEEVGLADELREYDAPLNRFVGDRGIQLSGGQRQRLAVARVLLRDPAIVILDEATSALDSVVERKVSSAIDRRTAGRTLIIVAHRLSTVRSADHILVFKDGQIVERGAWDDLLSKGGEFSRLHRAQFDGTKTGAY